MGIFETNYFSEFSLAFSNIIVYLVTYMLLFLLTSLFLFFNYKFNNTQNLFGICCLILLSGFPPSPLFFINIYALYYVFLNFGICTLISFLAVVVLFWYWTFATVMLVVGNFETVQYLLTLFSRSFRIVNIVHYFCISLFYLGYYLWLQISL